MSEATYGESASQWASRTYGEVLLADTRRQQRAVQVAEALARSPGKSQPAQLGSPAALKASYRLLESPQVSYERLMRPHWQQTRQQVGSCSQVLLIQDMTGLGPVGNGNHHGYLLQSVLAVEPASGRVLGLAAQEVLLRQPAPTGENTAQRARRRDKESQVWLRQVQACGAAPTGCQVIHVGDRGADLFDLLREGLGQGCDFVVRMQHDRRIDTHVEEAETPLPVGARRSGKQRSSKQEPLMHLVQEVSSWQGRGAQTVQLVGNQKRKEREAQLVCSWGQVRLWPPDAQADKQAPPLVVRVVRAWEPEPPEGEEALEWIWLTSVQVDNEEQAWQCVEWYRMRWLVEDYHQGLKTGCRIEERQVQTFEGLRTLLGFLAPLAVRLLQVRASARQEPEQPACEVLPMEVVRVVAHVAGVPAKTLTTRACWRRIAQAGGYQGRKGDGEPGWKTLWEGWLYIQTLLEGIRLAPSLLD